jgi:hypothetical protein
MKPLGVHIILSLSERQPGVHCFPLAGASAERLKKTSKKIRIIIDEIA